LFHFLYGFFKLLNAGFLEGYNLIFAVVEFIDNDGASWKLASAWDLARLEVIPGGLIGYRVSYGVFREFHII